MRQRRSERKQNGRERERDRTVGRERDRTVGRERQRERGRGVSKISSKLFPSCLRNITASES